MSSNTDDTFVLKFGRRTYPVDVQAVWGARLIWPNDLLWDRQDLISRNDGAKQELVAWLDGNPRGKGAIHEMRENLKEPYKLFSSQADEEQAVLYEDDKGIIVGSPQGSHGYVYVCAWLHKHDA